MSMSYDGHSVPRGDGVRHIVVLSGFIFFAEALVMFILELLELPERISLIVDPVLLLILLSPPLYYFMYRPLREHLSRYAETEVLLRRERRIIEEKFEERASQVVKKNEELIREITERKKIESELREKSEFLRVVIDSLDHPFYVIDAKNYTVKLANKAADFGDYCIGEKCYKLTHGNDAPCSGSEHPCCIAEVLRSKAPVIVEHVHRGKNGQERLVEVHAHPICDDHGEVIDIVEFVLNKDRSVSRR